MGFHDKNDCINFHVYPKIYLAVLTLIFVSSSYAFAIEGEAEPTQAEKDWFEAVKDRLEANMANWPHDISQKLTMIKTGTLELAARDCSGVEGTTVDEVRFSLDGKQIKWDHTLAKKFIPSITTANAGADIWDCEVTKTTEGTEIMRQIKNIACEDRLMIDVTKLPDNTNGQKLMNESILFHELLHGQLLLDAFANDEDYLEKMCKSFQATGGKVDFSPLDAGHETIPMLQGEYFEEAGPAKGFEVTIKEFKPAKKDDCTFSITVEEIFEGVEKEEVTDAGFYPLENIKSFNFDSEKGVLSGELEKNKDGKCLNGKMVFYFDPPINLVFGIMDIFAPPVGGTVLSPDSVSLLLLEAESSAIWWLPAVIIAGASLSLFQIKKKK